MTTKAERIHLSKVADLACIICRMPTEVHHIRIGHCMRQRARNFDVIPLCPNLHRTGGYGVAIHAGQKTFEANFGTETQLLAKTLDMLQ